ncbi:MAG TPA: hypothetical protein VG845_02190 [Dehalococcoidia bacterium]|jgi:hypothetical protein|nr:hypothetical protein [Dehalococcoidia bacterium]
MASDFSARSRLYQDALIEALAGGQSAIADAEPLQVLGALIRRCRPLVIEAEHAAGALDALEAVAAHSTLEGGLSDAAARFETPQRFREALFFVCCLERDPETALSLLEARAYLGSATVPAHLHPDIATDQAALLDTNTFDALWREPQRGAVFLNTIDIWQNDYRPAYTQQHAAFNAALTDIAVRMDALQPQVAALERLNTLTRLGALQAGPALAQYHELEPLFGCAADAESLGYALATDPTCAYCGFRLGDQPPVADADRVQQAIERGLAHQQSRLAQRVVRRLLARPGRAGSDRVDRFIEVVQASDLTGLAAVLDDGLTAFLRELLETPEPASNLLADLAASYPEITAANLEEALGELRILIQAELRRNDGTLRLAEPGA